MESIGDRLRVAREDKGYSFEQVARDTHIAKRYIEAMEQDDYQVFPGEPYLFGFLRNYADYLGLPSDEILNRYRNLKIQEQPVPMDQLLDTGRDRRLRSTVIVTLVVVIVLAAVSALFLFTDVASVFSARSERSRQQAAQESATDAGTAGAQNGPARSGDIVDLGADYVLERAFFRGERFVVDINGEQVPLSLDDIGEQVRVRFPGGTVSIPQGAAGLVDLNSSGDPDIRVIVRNVMLDTSPPEAVIRIDRQVAMGTDIAAAPQEPARSELPPAGMAGVEWRERETVTIRSTFTAPSFSLSLNANRLVLVRVGIDDADTEQYVLQPGEQVELSASEHVFVSASNGAALSLRVEGTEVTLGGPGQVSSVLVGLADRNTGSPRLAAIPSY
ncbi:MAG: hypothetical protein EA383_00630 [Spirochaetaceae bacterium]|nr:MAG: hypothetical protein EA383_00630 [Spirochaetaceae bacterium]